VLVTKRLERGTHRIPWSAEQGVWRSRRPSCSWCSEASTFEEPSVARDGRRAAVRRSHPLCEIDRALVESIVLSITRSLRQRGGRRVRSERQASGDHQRGRSRSRRRPQVHQLDAHLHDLTTRVIREAIDDDVSEPTEQASTKALPEANGG